MAFTDQNFTHRPPSALDLLSHLNERDLAWFNPQAAFQQLAGDGLCSLARMRGSTTALRSIDSVDLVGSALATQRAIRGICFNALLSQMPRELPPPIAQRRHLDVQPYPLFADRLDGCVYVRMGSLKAPCPNGFRRIRVHDLKHTFGRRLRAACVSFEDRHDLLGHKSARITTRYSAAEITTLIEAANKVCQEPSRKSPALLLLRSSGHTQVPEKLVEREGIEPSTPAL